MMNKQVDIPNHPGYTCTRDGTIFGKRGKPITQRVDRYGYLEVRFSENGKCSEYLSHRIICVTFNPIDNPEKYQVNHIDGNKLNNSIDNLEWCTVSENIRHAYRTGLHKNVCKEYHALEHEQVKNIYKLHSEGLSFRKIAKEVGCSRTTVARKIKEKSL